MALVGVLVSQYLVVNDLMSYYVLKITKYINIPITNVPGK
jgi:hypothetical protein